MRVLIVEDEARIAKRIKRMTADYLRYSPHEIVIASNLSEARTVISEKEIEVILLDLNLNGEDGFELLKPIVAEPFHTIIISANHDQALKAFEFGVLDFIPKPFNRERLEQALGRLNSTMGSNVGVNFLAVKKRGGLKIIKIEDIAYLRGADIYSELVLKDETTELHNKSLEKLEQLLSPDFERIHKSYLVPFSAIRGISLYPGSVYKAILKDGQTLPVGRSRYKRLKEKLTQFS